MPANTGKTISYFELTKHNHTQFVVFLVLIASGMALLLSITLPFFYHFFSNFLQGIVHTSGDPIPYVFEAKKSDDVRELNYFFSWAIDFDAKGTNPVRYWFNPTVSLILIISIFSLGFAALASSVLPRRIGLMRQKIEREIASIVNRISQTMYGFASSETVQEIYDDIRNCHASEINDTANEYKMTSDDLKVIKKGIIWDESNFFYKLLHINDGISVYMRFYFTIKYSNVVLGLVYIGASVLIVTVGLRGLKFIPPTQPSYVLFALGLEFSLLLTFAITTIYSRQDEEPEQEKDKNQNNSYSFPNEYGSAKEIEKLLKVFIKKDSDTKSKPKE